jgi:hypothetical protein
MASDQTELHNQLAGEIVKSIIRPVLDSGGRMSDVLVLLESVVLGVMLVAIKCEYSEAALDVVVERVKKRIADLHLAEIEPAGRA